MILKLGQLPAAARGHRILVRPDPPTPESDIIHKPEAYQYLPNKGVIIAAGMNALDQMHDHGDLIGDEVWWGKFAGVVEEWDHLENETDQGARCEHTWTRTTCDRPKASRWACDVCKSTRIAEHMLVMNIDDLLANVSLQRRLESGEVSIILARTTDGRTQHSLDRKDR